MIMYAKNPPWDAVGCSLLDAKSVARDPKWQSQLKWFSEHDELSMPYQLHLRDCRTPLRKGRDWAFEKLSEHQACAATALRAHSGQLIICQDTYEFRPGNSRSAFDLLIECAGRLVKLNCNLHGRSLENGWTAVGHFDWLPRPIAEAYYWRIDGWDVIDGIPPPSMANRMLPAAPSQWVPLERSMQEMDLSEKYQSMVIARLKTLWPECFPDDWQEKLLVRCFIDNRPHGNNGPSGDLIFARAFNPGRELYHIKDGDFEHPRVLVDPVNTIDRYVEHVLLWRKERFDFTPHGIPVT
jgi:hypothetical protein